ncbi:hypothetical protein V8C86DRAFT_2453623 [Haematococcus lacustris]
MAHHPDGRPLCSLVAIHGSFVAQHRLLSFQLWLAGRVVLLLLLLVLILVLTTTTARVALLTSLGIVTLGCLCLAMEHRQGVAVLAHYIGQHHLQVAEGQAAQDYAQHIWFLENAGWVGQELLEDLACGVAAGAHSLCQHTAAGQQACTLDKLHLPHPLHDIIRKSLDMAHLHNTHTLITMTFKQVMHALNRDSISNMVCLSSKAQGLRGWRLCYQCLHIRCACCAAMLPLL